MVSAMRWQCLEAVRIECALNREFKHVAGGYFDTICHRTMRRPTLSIKLVRDGKKDLDQPKTGRGKHL